MAVNGFGGVVHQHAQFKLRVSVQRVFGLQNTVHKVRHHLIADKFSGIAAIRGIIQVGPEMIDQILLCQTQIGVWIVNQMPNALACSGVQMSPIGPFQFTLGVGKC